MGFTIVEMLAVIVIISLVAGVTMVNLASTSDAMKRREAVGLVRDLDARARLMARSGETVRLVETPDGDGLSITTADDGDVLATVELPIGVHGALRSDADATGSVTFDRSGRSIDYAVALTMNGAATIVEFGGLTGLVIVAESES